MFHISQAPSSGSNGIESGDTFAAGIGAAKETFFDQIVDQVQTPSVGSRGFDCGDQLPCAGFALRGEETKNVKASGSECGLIVC